MNIISLGNYKEYEGFTAHPKALSESLTDALAVMSRERLAASHQAMARARRSRELSWLPGSWHVAPISSCGQVGKEDPQRQFKVSNKLGLEIEDGSERLCVFVRVLAISGT